MSLIGTRFRWQSRYSPVSAHRPMRGNNIVFDLWFLPLTTMAIAWAAASATARLHRISTPG